MLNTQGQIGLIFHNFNLFPHLTVLKNLTLSPIRQHKIPRDIAIQKARNLLNFLQLGDKEEAYLNQLSGDSSNV